MASFNKVNLIGNLTRDPELRHTPQGKAVCDFTVAVNGIPRGGDIEIADFIPVTVWEKSAEACAKHLKKASLVHVDGRLKQDRWEKDGKKHSRLTVVASSVTFLGGTKKAGETAQATEPPSPEPEEEEVPEEEEIPS